MPVKKLIIIEAIILTGVCVLGTSLGSVSADFKS